MLDEGDSNCATCGCFLLLSPISITEVSCSTGEGGEGEEAEGKEEEEEEGGEGEAEGEAEEESDGVLFAPFVRLLVDMSRMCAEADKDALRRTLADALGGTLTGGESCMRRSDSSWAGTFASPSWASLLEQSDLRVNSGRHIYGDCNVTWVVCVCVRITCQGWSEPHRWGPCTRHWPPS